MSFFRNTIWFVKGMKEYTKGGYASASKNFRAGDLAVDVTGRSFMITGANSGLGKATAMALAQRGGTVHIVCRNKERGEEARTEITETTGNQNVFLHELDTSKPADIYAFVKTFEASGNALHVLINNAGCMINTRSVTDDGLEKNFATNTLGTHVLTTALIPLLSKATDPRVIIVSSGGMLTKSLDVEDLQFERMQPFDGTSAYAQNKRQQIVMTEQYAKKFPDIHFSSMHPGWADTPAVQTSMPGFYEKMKTRLRTVEEGADTIVWLAASPAGKTHKSGLFFQDRHPTSTHLPLSFTKSRPEQDQQLMDKLDEMAARCRQ
ncbi:dehydrogenase/reductase SDR family member 12-like isoform X3 [Dreissena polymorpha]|uniref:dehydrogenase/reductase SDR family member 12-like isoform X3 n=1 Tax=Dreissena polymorpha TaxID=45954 RepID=UPI0022652518|nr:dehydrogenase/reductase SDR family member 12-like isoform X3 [Dreissena polymorpha]